MKFKLLILLCLSLSSCYLKEDDVYIVRGSEDRNIDETNIDEARYKKYIYDLGKFEYLSNETLKMGDTLVVIKKSDCLEYKKGTRNWVPFLLIHINQRLINLDSYIAICKSITFVSVVWMIGRPCTTLTPNLLQ